MVGPHREPRALHLNSCEPETEGPGAEIGPQRGGFELDLINANTINSSSEIQVAGGRKTIRFM